MGASDKDVKNRIFFRVIFLSPLDEDGSDGRGSFNLCTVKVWNCNKLRKNGSRESITFRLFFIISFTRDLSLNSKLGSFQLAILSCYFLILGPKLFHEFSFSKRTYLLNNNQIPPSSNPPLLPPPLPYPLPSLIIGAKNCTPIEVLAPKRNGRKSGDIVSTQRYVAR